MARRDVGSCWVRLCQVRPVSPRAPALTPAPETSPPSPERHRHPTTHQPLFKTVQLQISHALPLAGMFFCFFVLSLGKW